jgi:LysM repeat protein
MAALMKRRLLSALLAAGAVPMLAVACFGGGGGDDAATNRVTDPALVPTATPNANPMVYRFKNDDIQFTGGTAATPQGGGSGDPQSHTVGSGETCAEIAGQYNITVDALIRANRSINAECTNLREGDRLRIPSAAPTATPEATSRPGPGTPTPRPSGREHTVAAGDTCADIADSYGISADDLIRVNGLDADCTTLQPGQKLKIP